MLTLPKVLKKALTWNIDRLLNGESVTIGDTVYWAIPARQGTAYDVFFDNYDRQKRNVVPKMATIKLVKDAYGNYCVVTMAEDFNAGFERHKAWLKEMEAKGYI